MTEPLTFVHTFDDGRKMVAVFDLSDPTTVRLKASKYNGHGGREYEAWVEAMTDFVLPHLNREQLLLFASKDPQNSNAASAGCVSPAHGLEPGALPRRSTYL